MTKTHLTVAVCGHSDTGKSTTCGHLIFKQGGISAPEMEKLHATATEQGKPSHGFAYYLDTEKDERARGVTIQCNTKEFFTEKYHYTIVDAPGHRDYIKNMITGAATADVGLLLVAANREELARAIYPANYDLGISEGQTLQHARILNLLGVNQIIVGLNKMDACRWSEAHFNEFKMDVEKMLKRVGFRTSRIPIIPYSSYNGDNLVEKSDNAPWYNGWSANITRDKVVTGFTILDALNDFVQPPSRQPELPLRLPISAIYNIKGVGQIIGGTVEQGTLSPGDTIGIVPSGLRNKKIVSIQQHKKTLEKAVPGDSVGISIEGILEDEKVKRGDVIFLQKDGDLKPIKAFTAMVQVQTLSDRETLKPGYSPVVFCGTDDVACKMTKILWKQGRCTGGKRVQNPSRLYTRDLAEVEFEPTAPLFVESFATSYNTFGRMVVMDSNQVKMLGKVTSTTQAE